MFSWICSKFQFLLLALVSLYSLLYLCFTLTVITCFALMLLLAYY
uniref:Transmembrane protein n=1 Tax=Arabidopsis thaliana TaxID=3702 RepID=Q56WG5_ARATH|nr:hypothetical protein [Arabidopsis thaliana]